jgi:hypothetical protein
MIKDFMVHLDGTVADGLLLPCRIAHARKLPKPASSAADRTWQKA